jgi:hypothetical protein
MKDDNSRPQINVSKIVTGGGIAGAIFAVTSILIFLFGIPALAYFLPAAIVLGIVAALLIRLARHETPGKPWILAESEKEPAQQPQQQRETDRPGDTQRSLRPAVCN